VFEVGKLVFETFFENQIIKAATVKWNTVVSELFDVFALIYNTSVRVDVKYQ